VDDGLHGDCRSQRHAQFEKKLNGVSHVKSASVDHEQAAALIVPIDGKEISPKALWEAVEATGYKPTELKGPSGTFKKKPSK